MSDLITIGSYYTVAEAETLKALLGEEGITAFVSDGEVSSINFLLTPAIGGVKLQTAAEDAERARAVIASHGGYQYNGSEAYEAEADGSTTCMACGAKIGAEKKACAKCGWTYEQAAE